MAEGKSIKEHMKEMVKDHGGDMHVVHGHEEGFTSHHMSEEGQYEGPTEHKTVREAKSHMADCLEGE